MKIAVIGASGWLGGLIAEEALERRHDVVAIGRNAEKLVELDRAYLAVADLDDGRSIIRAIRGSDVVASAVTDRSTEDRSRIPATARRLLDLARLAGVHRLAFVGGGGSLEVQPGVRAVDAPTFPEHYKPEALAQAEALAILRSYTGDIGWTYMSPPPHELLPGPKTSRYSVQAGDAAVVNADGDSCITSGDFAAAFVDELEQNRFPGQRFTAGS